MEALFEKYSKHYSNFMGTFTFNVEEITSEIIDDFKGWEVNRVQGQVIYYRED